MRKRHCSHTVQTCLPSLLLPILAPKVSFFLMGRRKGAARFLQWSACRELWGNPLTWAAFPVPVLCPALTTVDTARQGMLLLPPARKFPEVNYWTTSSSGIWASLEQGKQHFSTNNTATEIYVFFAIWFLFSKSENAEELTQCYALALLLWVLFPDALELHAHGDTPPPEAFSA